VGAPPESDNEAILGFDCLHRVAQSYLGPLWIAADVRGGVGTLGLLRRLALPDQVPEEARREIASLGRHAIELDHPSVLRVREVIEQGELLALFYEHAEAEPLRSLQSWANLRGLSFPIGVALRIMVDLLHGLEAAHALSERALGASACGGLSPDSVLIARDGATRLCDPLFSSGAARVEGIGFNTAKLAYAAPEQVHAAASPTPQTDLFTCAAMLWELLASRRLLAGSRPAIERKLLEHNLPGLRASLRAPQQVSDELVALVELTLSADPSERPRSAKELAQRLGECGHELAPLTDVAAFVGKLSGPRFDRRTAAIRSRSSGSLALDDLKLPLELAKSSGGRAAGTEPTSEIDTPRAPGSPTSERGGPPRPAASSPTNVVPAPPSAPRPAPTAAREAAAREAATREAAPVAAPPPSAPFSAAPVEPPGLGFAPAPASGRNPALWDQMVAPSTPAVTQARAEVDLGVRTLSGIGGRGHPTIAASLPFANLTPAPFPEVHDAGENDGSEAGDAAHDSPLAPPVEAAPPAVPHDPLGIAALHAAASSPPTEAPLPFEHLLPTKRGPSQRPSLEPGSQNWFELHAQSKSLASRGSAGSLFARPVFWVSLIVLALISSGTWLVFAKRRAASMAAIAERPEPTQPPVPAPSPEPPAAVAPAPVAAPSDAPDAGAPAKDDGVPAPAAKSPPRADAADFTAAKLDDSQLVVLFALEGRGALPTCTERLGDSVRKYSGNDMRRSGLQIKAARRMLAQGDAMAAHELACSAVAHSPRNPAAQRTLAELALELGDPTQAKVAVERALAQAPKDKGLQAMRGDVLAVMGDIAGGRSIWLRGATVKGSKAVREKRLVAAYRKAGEKALASSDWAEAAVYFRRAVVLTHGSFAPSLGLCEALLGLDHSRAALVWAERAARALPKDARVQVLFGDALYENGQNEKARAAWQAALDVQPSSRLAARRLREGKP
jgi:tetratricopeptide (TPR) repeat protein